MIALLPFLMLSGLAHNALPLPLQPEPHAWHSWTRLGAQEPETPAAKPAAEPQKPEKKKFARLSSPDKDMALSGLPAIEKGEKQEDIDAGVKLLLDLGEAVIPLCLDSVARMEKVSRLDPLWACLNGVLVDDDLKLAWTSLSKKSPDAARMYLLRRYSDSTRKDAADFLQLMMASKAPAVAYEAARGLVLRGNQDALSIIEEHIQSRWLKEAATFRLDFAKVNRQALSSALAPWLKRTRLKEKLAGLRMFELFGIPEHIRLVAPFLAESDTSLRLAAINACRVVVAKEVPLERPSMTEIIERAEAWKAKL